MPNIYFPYLNLSFNISPIAFKVFGIAIYWYGIIITSGIICGALISSYMAKKENVNPDIITDFIMYDIIFALIGARAYYVAFNWDYYHANLGQIINTRQGGIAIYGAIIVSILVAVIYTKYKKISFWQFTDLAVYGLVVGQIIGRYGNFTNKEAFGGYTENIFAMRILQSEAKLPISQDLLNHIQVAFGQNYIQVHPTFFYESCWNIGVLVLLLIYRKYRKNYGELFFLYLASYGIGRFWIEGLRTDQLIVPSINIPISQIIAILSVVLGLIGIIICRRVRKK
ncbi:prolipoprotein diacylglyceryl transferase [Cellulosilyticum ruminicola]|uniref:prolipoprotein diacylglyceryl transferase n=1 Tax=Cellulosilyticum ruminicola TaxID=425254 RepID=UPI0009F89FE6|nr:prolipoprotein diacylglyceryl transferase [Cellulosilyticum ruminicola]